MIPPTLINDKYDRQNYGSVISVLALVCKQTNQEWFSKHGVTYIIHRSMFHREAHKEAVR
jgi:hypothetical protein